MKLFKFLGDYPYTVLVTLVAITAFFTLGSDFLFIDDTILVVNNPQVFFSLQNITAIFTKPLGQIHEAADYPIRFIYYRPALSLLYMLNNSVWGINPVGFHIINLALHLFTAIVTYRIGMVLFERNSCIALLAAALFCVHPVHNELVGRVAMNENLLGFFMAAALLWYLQERKYLSLFAFTLALLTKESAVMLPFIMFLFALRTKGLTSSARLLAPYGIVVAVYLLIRTLIFGAHGEFVFNGQLLEPLLAACSALAEYLRLLFVPYPLSIYYPVWRLAQPLQPELLLTFIVLLLLLYVIWKFHEDALLSPLLVVLLVPVVIKANAMILGEEMGFIAERQLYVPSILFSLFIAALVHKCTKSGNSPQLLAVFPLIIPLSFYLQVSTSAVWHDSNVLSLNFIEKFPDSAVAHRKKGLSLLRQGDADGALLEFTAALPVLKKEIPDKSIETDKKSRAKSINMNNFAAYKPAYADIHRYIGMVYIAKNDYDTAIRKLKTSLVLQPHSVDARTALAGIYMKKRLYKDASREYRLALKDIDALKMP